jgi:methionine-rich copper-binding protein CopC
MKKLVLASILLFAATFLITPSAIAHDDVVSSYPASGETVEAGPIGILIDFSNDVMANENNEGFEIRVSDAQGNVQPVSCLSASGATLSSTASLAADGDYVVDWRSVGNDGHAVEGTFKFSVVNTTNYEQQTADQIACAAALDSAAPVTTADGTRSSDDNGAFAGLLIGAGLIVLGTVAGIVSVYFRQQKERKKPKVLYKD